MLNSTNYDLNLPQYNDYADVKMLNSNFNIIDNGLALNVGNSTGTGNNYILDIGTITLTSANKGIRFMFFADKDSDTTNTVKIVINNKTYILLDMNKKNVRKIKKGVPITIAYAGDDTNFFLASGGEVTDYESTSIATDGSNVLAPNTFIGTDGEIHTGTMPNNGTKTKQLAINETYTLGKGYYDSITVNQNIPILNGVRNATGVAKWGDGGLAVYPEKGYQKGGSGDGEIKVSVSQMQSVNAWLRPDSILAGREIFGINGIATVQSMGGKRCITGQYTPTSQREFVRLNGGYKDTKYYVSVTGVPFTPSYIFCFKVGNIISSTIYDSNDGRFIYISFSSTSNSSGYQEHYRLSDNSFAIENGNLQIPVSSSGGDTWNYVVLE